MWTNHERHQPNGKHGLTPLRGTINGNSEKENHMVKAIVTNDFSSRSGATVLITEQNWRGDSFWVPIGDGKQGMVARRDLKQV